MAHTLPLAAFLLALTSTALAAQPARRPPEATPAPVREERASYGPDTPPLVRDALVGLRLFRLHQGRNGLDPAATARQGNTGDAP